MYKNNSRDSSKNKRYSPHQLSCNLTEMNHEIGYYSITSLCKQLLKTMIFKKETKDNELYLYMNGKLIYKKWLDTGASKVFDIQAYDKFTLKSIKDTE
jgi:hypothetical protein